MSLTRSERRQLRSTLSDEAPWLTNPEAGPQAVDAGQCDRCGDNPRALPTCGPVQWRALCRACGLEVGSAAWCDGHADRADQLLAWASDLPPWWGDAVILWWVATGEVEAPPPSLAPGLPAGIRDALPAA